MSRPTFKIRKIKGDKGEYIFLIALEKGIIPNMGDIMKFEVISGNKNSIKVNLHFGDFAFRSVFGEIINVDVKCGDDVSLRCLNNLKDGSYLFLNAYNTVAKDICFMFKLDAKVKEWIKAHCKKIYRIENEIQQVYYRILRTEIELILPKGYMYEFDNDLFHKHKVDMKIEMGDMIP